MELSTIKEKFTNLKAWLKNLGIISDSELKSIFEHYCHARSLWQSAETAMKEVVK